MKQSLKSSLKVLIFLVSAIIIFYLLPREGQFKYEYQQGKPWNYGLIVAPFDFPLQKTDLELSNERDSLLVSYHPYYEIDSVAYANFLDKMNDGFDRSWSKFSQRYTLDDSLSTDYKQALVTITSEVYKGGIMPLSDINALKENDVRAIVVVRSDYSIITPLEKLMTPRSSYEKIISLSKAPNQLREFEALVQDVNLNNYLYSNLVFNSGLSEKVRADLLSSISLTSGMVQTGERLIDKGELVTYDVFIKLESYKKEYTFRLGTSDQRKYLMVGQVLLISVFIFMLYLFLFTYRRETLQDTKDVLFIMLNIVLFVATTAFVDRFFPSVELYVIPFAILAICLHTFFDSRIAIFVNMIAVFISSFYAVNPFDFAILHILSGTVATYSVRNLNRRGQVFRTAALVFLTYSVVYFALSLIQEGSLKSVNYTAFILFLVNAIVLTFSYPLMFAYEKIFKYLSNVTLIELSDTNHELLQDLSENAPGTFQHSLMVANLSQQAAKAIGANALLVKVGAYYHDIGKLGDPSYFTENQAGNYNPHDFLSPEDSAKKIINHVENGVKLARKHSLPQPVIDFIRMHHGRGQTKFFLYQYKKDNPDGDTEHFSYPGPSPLTKETAILMMADAVEAASRSLEEYTDVSISGLVDKIVDTQLAEGNFKYAPITFVDVETVKEVFKKRLKIIYHSRIAYPEQDKPKQ